MRGILTGPASVHHAFKVIEAVEFVGFPDEPLIERPTAHLHVL